MNVLVMNQLVPGVSSDIGAAFIAGKPAPTGTAHALVFALYLWELACWR